MTEDELMSSAEEAIDFLTDIRQKLYDFSNGELETKDRLIPMAQLQKNAEECLERGKCIVYRLWFAHPEEMENRSGNFFDKAFWIYSLCDEIGSFLFWDRTPED